MPPRLALAGSVNGVLGYAEASCESGGREAAAADLANDGFGEYGVPVDLTEDVSGAKTAKLYTVLHVTGTGHVFEVLQAVVGTDGVYVVNLEPRLAFTYVRSGNKPVDEAQLWPRALPPAKVDGGVPAAPWGGRVEEPADRGGAPLDVSADLPIGRHGIAALEPDYWSPLGMHHG